MASLEDAVRNYLKKDYISFHTPGHKGRPEFFAAFRFPEFDLTELPGLDMLHHPTGAILDAEREAARLCGSEECFFLVNGGTAGNQAMMMSLMDGKPKVVRITRDAHRSVMAALILSGLTPQYCPVVIHPDFNLPLGLDVEMFTNLGRADAWHLTCPTYYGTLPDLLQIIEARNARFPDLPVLVDQAHGAHYLGREPLANSARASTGSSRSNDFLFPPSAVRLGADLTVHSLHKTLSALTQAAALHVQGNRINRVKLRQALEMLQSSSPSYLFLVSIERAMEVAAQSEKRWQRLYEAVTELKARLAGSYRILSADDEGYYGIWRVDWTKILVNTRPLGVKASACVDFLRREYGIEPELWDDENILFLLGIGNEPEDVRRLGEGLHAYLRRIAEGPKLDGVSFRPDSWADMPLPPLRLSPREAFRAPKRRIPLAEAVGKISGETISPYPPGIPLVVMGEEITPEVQEFLSAHKTARFQGWEGAESGQIWVIEDGVCGL